MLSLYNLSIRSYAIVVKVVSIYNKKANLWVNGRVNWQDKLSSNVSNSANLYWFHCASLGEFEQAVPLMEELKKEDPTIDLLITFFSPSGYELKKNYPLAKYVAYLPIDTNSNATEFLGIAPVKKAFFIKYEFWYHYFTELKSKDIPFYMVSSTFRRNQLFFKWYGKWFKQILELPTNIFVQNNTSKELLSYYGIKSECTGDTRYDKVIANSKFANKNDVVHHFKAGQFMVIAGSSWEQEEELLKSVYNEQYKLIIAPHDISASHLSNIYKLFPKAISYSKYDFKEYDILVIDNIGILSNIYQYGDLAFVGGGFKNALHNILEPATFGLPVLYGSNTSKYPESNDMVEYGSGFFISTSDDLKVIIDSFIKEENYLKKLKTKNIDYIQSRSGATKKIVASIKKDEL